jgi:hypothetical protein
MAIWTFRSAEEPDWCAITVDRKGAALPEQLGPWVILARQTVPRDANMLERDERVKAVIQRDGFYLFRSEKPRKLNLARPPRRG